MPVYEYKASSNKLNLVAGGTFYADAPIGSIIPYGGATAPSGWLLCQGQAVSRAEYAELFKAIGIAFGEGDGSTTFNVPDLREATTKGAGLSVKSPYHYDNAGLKVGQYVIDQLMRHDHNVYVRDTGHSHTMNYDNNAQYAPGAYGFLSPMKPTTSPRNAVTESGNAQIQVNSNSGFDGTANTTSTAGTGVTNEVKAVGVNYIIKAKQSPVPADFMNAVDDAMNECKILPYELNRSSNVPAFNRKWLVTGNSIVWTATHTGRLTIRCLKHGDGYSLYLTNQNSVMLDSYDNFFGDTEHGLTVSEASITLQAWVRKGDVIELSTNLPADTEWADKYFVQTGLLLYNDTFD